MKNANTIYKIIETFKSEVFKVLEIKSYYHRLDTAKDFQKEKIKIQSAIKKQYDLILDSVKKQFQDENDNYYLAHLTNLGKSLQKNYPLGENYQDGYIEWYQTVNQDELDLVEQITEMHKFELQYFLVQLKELIETTKLNTKPKQTGTLKVNQIALIHAYENKHITRTNANAIAAKYGYENKNSGEGLYQDYLKYYKVVDRTGNTGTKRTMKSKIELFESITTHLTVNAESRAKDEIKILKTIFEKEYP